MLQGTNGDRCTRLHESSTEEAFVVAIIGDHMQRRGDGTRRLAPKGDLGGVAPKLGNVLLDPSECLTLVVQTKVAYSGGTNFLAGQESIGTDTIWDRCERVMSGRSSM